MLYSFEGKRPVLNEGTYVSDSARIIGDVVIGSGCYIGHGAILRGDYGCIRIGDETAVEEGVIVHAPVDESVSIGTKVTIGHGAIVHGKHIADYAVIGMGAVISLWAEIGEWSIIAEGCVVKLRQEIPARVVAAGNPARIRRDVSEKDREFWNRGKQIYIDLARRYLHGGMQKFETA